jgi:sec-independent protein translocase protein TatB
MVRFFDLGFAEMLVIGIVALIVVGPKDLPVLFRQAGQFMGKAKGMAREFTKAMNDAADDAGMKDIQKTIRTATNPVNSAMDGVRDAAKSMTSLDVDKKINGAGKAPEKKTGFEAAEAKSEAAAVDSETAKLAREREEAKRKIEASAARAAANRKKREAEEAIAKAEEMERALAAGKASGEEEGKA